MQDQARNYAEITSKMLEHQRNIVSKLKEQAENGGIPSGLEKAISYGEGWAKAVEGSSLENPASLDDAIGFSDALQDDKKHLDAHLSQEAEQYRALLGDLKKTL